MAPPAPPLCLRRVLRAPSGEVSHDDGRCQPMPLDRTTASVVRYHEVHAVRSRLSPSPAGGVTGGESSNKYNEEKMSGRGTVDGGPGKGNASIIAQPLSASDRLLSPLTTKSCRLPEVDCRCCSPASLCLCAAGCQSAFFLSVLATADRSPPPRGRSPAEPRHKANCSYTVKED